MSDPVNKEAKDRLDIAVDIHTGTATWNLHMVGDVGGLYAGIFKFRGFLTPTQQINANREYRQLLGENATLAPEHDSFLAYTLTQLKYRILESPPFWMATQQTNGYAGDIPDTEVLNTILDAAIASELKYKDMVRRGKVDALDRAKKAAEKMLQAQKDEDFEDEEETENKEN